jgi:hypothetical protein
MTERKKPARLEGGKGTTVARQRYELYKLANEQLKAAYEQGFYIECVSICESIIADRLEARVQFLRRDSDKPTHLESLGTLLKQLNGLEPMDHEDLRAVYSSLQNWGDARNATIHQFVKVADHNHQSGGDERIHKAKAAARDGMRLMRQTSALIRKYNKW